MKLYFILNFAFGIFVYGTDGQCAWPDAFKGTTWTDTEKGELAFGETTMTGWSFQIDGQVRNEWKCVKSDTFEEDGYLLMVTTESFVQFVTAHYYAYLCLKTKKITDVSYRYYIEAPIQRNVDYERILIYPYDTLTAVENACLSSIGASGSEYKLLIKTGSEMSAAIQCPYAFLGLYDYTHTSSDGTETCTDGNNIWNTCADNSQMTFNLAQCPTKVSYSGSSTVMCVDTVPVNQNNYVTVFNYQDATVDDVTTFRFACFGISADGSQASVAPKYCRKGQTPDSVPNSNSNVPVGATMTIPTTYATCPTCPLPESPDGGSVYVQTDGAVTSAIYTCAEDYSLYGKAIRTCLSDNTWEFEIPACKCNEPTPPDNGEVSVSVDGVIASYVCNVGYTLNGNSERFCQDDGKAWNGTDPTCDICDPLSDPVGGSVTVSQEGATSKASYTCDVEYTLAGVKERLCMNGGTWRSSEPTCVLCALLTIPDLGSVNITTDGYNSAATFSCLIGYKLSDNKSLLCRTDGAWDAKEPECICEPLLPPADGTITTSSDSKTVTYSCNSGYTLNGDAVRVCRMDGTAWNGTDPTCVKCPDLPELASGKILSSSLGSQAVTTFTCNSGYTLSGPSTLSCLSNGSWDGAMPECILCELLSNLASGTVTIATNGSMSSANYTCSSGYTLDGASAALCLTDGLWDISAPRCYCDKPSAPLNGDISLSGDKLTVTYQCDVGYTIAGSSERSCQDDSTGWTNSDPSCSSCQTLPNLSGGSVSLITTGTVTQADFTCDVGYTMNGGSLLTCRSDGSWNVAAPTCVLCSVPSTPAGGAYHQQTNGKVTTTTFTCESGYGLNGGNTSDCRSDGTWDYSGPTCVKCPVLSSPASGSVAISSDGSHSVAAFSCVVGYSMQGNGELRCGSTGIWNDVSPSCVCDDPVSVSHGTVSANGSVAVYTCDTGYSLSGSSTRNCADDGTGWSGTAPSCVTCDAMSNPLNGNISLFTDGTKTTVTFTCNIDYTINGPGTAMCQSDGTWDTLKPDCVKCEQLIEPSSGSFSSATNGTATSAVFSCIPGYEVLGIPTLTCDGTGSWNGEEPSCVCEPPAAPVNGSLSLSADRLSVSYSCDVGYTLLGVVTSVCKPEGLSWTDEAPTCVSCTIQPPAAGISSAFSSNGTVSEVRFNCDSGYTMIGIPLATCQTDGQLDLQAPTCVVCASIDTPQSGLVSVSTNGTTSMATYSCAEGYTGVGDTVRTCGEDGQWHGSEIVCLCRVPVTPVNGNLSISMDGLAATYVCDTGYILVGDRVRICSDDGTGWSGNDPSCSTCDPIVIPSGASMNLSSDGTNTLAIFTCNVGASLLGEPVLTCLEDGTWDLSPPTCVSCPTLSDPDSGNVTTYTDGQVSTAEFLCAEDYYLFGTATLSCLTIGDWNDDSPTCVCDPPNSVENGMVQLLDNNAKASYTCDLGLSLKGDSERLCSTDGSGWTSADPTCVSCPTLISPDGGTVTKKTDGLTTIALFACDTEYSMKGSPYLSCITNGTWNNSSPSCVSCPSLNAPSSGSINISSVGVVTIATYTCNVGYTLVGSSDRTCSDIGVWDATDPRCVCKPPNTPANGHIKISEDGMTINYTCNTGYSLNGVGTRLCQTDGLGWNELDPTCHGCDALNNLNGGSVSMTTDGSETQAIFSCGTGYSMNGGSVLTCRSNGSWDVSPPSCTSCQTQAVPIGGDVVMATDGETTTANFSCSAGYTIKGQSNVTCRGDGSWDFISPSCVQCAVLSSPASGSYVLTTDGLATVAVFTCASKYSMVGTGQLTCDMSGEWDGKEPVCICDSPTPPLHGSIAADGLLAIYQCDTGFTLYGLSTRGCNSDGTWWNGTAPTCVQCSPLSSLQNGNISLHSDGVTTISSYTCGPGYTLKGVEVGTCGDDGSWSIVSSPSCVECQSLSAPTSGSFTITTNGTATSAEFSCISGYEVFGRSVTTCDDNGVWDASEPTCVCEEPALPTNGAVELSEDRLTLSFFCDVGFSLSGSEVLLCQTGGAKWNDISPTCVECSIDIFTNGLNFTLTSNGTVSMVAYSCDAGYTMSGTQHTSCLPDGSLESQSPTCVTCPSLVTPTSGTLDITTNGTMSEATYVCANDYTLVGDAVMTCNVDGVWSGVGALCVCDHPLVPTNGNLSVSPDGQTVTYFCDVGYILIGNKSRNCNNDGTGWSGIDPTCGACDTLVIPSGGNVTLSTDGSVTSAEFACDVGATLVGASLLTCQVDGDWNVSAPYCSQCPTLSNPESGFFTMSSDGKASFAKFECSAGYSVVGTIILTCQKNGLWNDSSPICVCDSPSTPDSGQLLISDNGFKATYTCDTGYTLRGVRERQCGTNSTGWSGDDPNCVGCPILSQPTNGNFSLSTDGHITSALFACDIGFSMVGTAIVDCLDIGIWNDTEPTCVSCPTPASPDSGDVAISGNGVLTTASFTCTLGYDLVGDDYITCLNDGTWNSTEPICVCKPPSAPNNGNITVSLDRLSVYYSCLTGYTLEGVATRLCLSDGTGWDGSSPSCEACDSLPNLAGGTIIQSTDGSVTQALVSCDTGYTMNGNPSLSCRSDGTWNMSQPSCTPCQSQQVPAGGDICLSSDAPCQSQQVPAGGDISLSSDGKTTTALFQCLQGYSLQGISNISCRSDGSWDYISPTCVQCSTLSKPDSGSYVISTDGITTIAIFSCATGYFIDGSSVLSCDANGVWNNSEPLCKCDALPALVDGQVVHSDDGMTAIYKCNSGFTLDGVKTRICGTDGSGWSEQYSACVKCQDLDAISNGQVVLTTNSISAVAEFSCEVGSSLNGSSSAVCGTDGLWNNVEPLCAVCPNISHPANGSMHLSTDGRKTTAVFSCDIGHSLSGDSILTCGSDGQWSSTEPVCVDCAAINSLSSGVISIITNGSATRASFDCDSGYNLRGMSDITCSADGTWETSFPFCICDKPSAPANGSVWTSADGLTAIFTCDTGLTLDGHNSSICADDGSGWSNAEPTCVQCQNLLNFENGNQQLTTDGTVTKALFTCNEGYSLTGSPEISCQRTGLWEIHTSIKCVKCMDLPTISNGLIALSSDGVINMAMYTCFSGYQLVGTSSRRCGENGTWSGSEPVCICNSPSAPANGNITVTEDHATATAYCNTGYTISGTKVRNCQSDGSGWDGTEPICEICSTVSSPSGGAVQLLSDGIETTAIFSCNLGYSMEGYARSVCRADGSWDISAPTCEIGKNNQSSVFVADQKILTLGSTDNAGNSVNIVPNIIQSTLVRISRSASKTDVRFPLETNTIDGHILLEMKKVQCEALSRPANGLLVYSTDGISTFGRVECEARYTLNGAAFLLCLSDGRWNDTIPTCVSCPELQFPDSGMVEIQTDGVTSMAIFSCLSGYYLHGENTLTCRTDGTWDNTDPICKCILPPLLDYGNYLKTDNDSVVIYSCAVGYTLNGNSVRQCQQDGGGWDGSQPSCTGCQAISSPENGTVSIQTAGVITEAIFECTVGFSISSSSNITCLPDGSWDLSAPNCVKCGDTIRPDNGNISIETNGTISTAVYSCDVGYSVADAVLHSVTCQSNGSWELHTPSCTACQVINRTANGISTLSTNGTYTVASFECMANYFLSGDSEIVCQEDGSWDRPQPVCLCNAPAAPLNGKVNSDGTKAGYKCDQGYSMNGTDTLYCSQDVSGWIGTPPLCTKCQSLPESQDTSYTASTNGITTSTIFTCPLGQSVNGSATLTCNSEGAWSSGVPSCVHCQELSSIPNGLYNLTTDSTSTYASYSCGVKYYINGPSVRKCLDSGLWDGIDPRCVCSPPGPLLHGAFTISDDYMSVTFECEPGYAIKGHGALTCLEDGNGWSHEVPACTVCETLPTPAGSSVAVTFKGTTSVAEYTCNNGFTINGSSSMTCRDDGTWNITAPTCVSCPIISSPANGNVEVNTNGIVTTAYYSCNLGYALDGSSQMDCQADGLWDREPPICVTCPVLVSPSSGVMSQWSNGLQTFANISCASDYDLVGTPQLTCDSTGTWNHDLPRCYCQHPIAPEYGSMEIQLDNSTTIFTCDTGYSLNGVAKLSCQTDGSGWDGVVPVCETCKSLAFVENGKAVLSTNGTLTVSAFTCESGTSLNGNSLVECGADGQWNDTPPTCVTCPLLTRPLNGNVLLATDGTNTRASFSCDEGFTLKGATEIVCNNVGEWNDQEPVCVQCAGLTSPSSGTVIKSTNGSVTSAIITCAAGYNLAGSAVLSCRTDGTWDRSFPTCVCGTPFELDNGGFTISIDGMSALYACYVGYTLVGTATRICSSNGTGWEGTTPTCVLCQSPPDIPEGAYAQQTNGTFSTLIYSCPLGHSLNGSKQLTCREDGSWDFFAPTCVPCSTLEDIQSGNYVTSNNGTHTVAEYSCGPGYALVGSSILNCLSDGSWDSQTPVCHCEAPEVPSNGHVYSNGTIATYSCDTGYSMNGVPFRTCQESGSGWSDSPPLCHSCLTLTVPAGGNLTFSSNGKYTSVAYACEVGYTLDGARSLSCLSDGTWNAEPPTCGVPCSALSTPNNGTAAIVSDGSTTTATFQCETGSTLKGESTVTCRADGTWDFIEPLCVSCPALSSLSSGEISVTTDGTTSIARFACLEGYQLIGSDIVECTNDGTWNLSSPVCNCVLPSIPESGSYKVSEGGSVVVFSCENGTTLRGSSQLKCMDDGSGYNTSVPECVRCEEPPLLTEGSQQVTTDGITSIVTLLCDIGYSLKGSGTLFCSDNGTWNTVTTPECVQCPALQPPTGGNSTITTNNTATLTTFKCDVGYTLKGSVTAVCQTDGTWDSAVPDCVLCPAISTPYSGSIIVSADGSVTIATFSCEFGYYLSGEATLRCLDNGNWDAEEPICVCNEPYQPSNSDIMISDNGYTVNYKCHLGYSLSGSPSRQCQRHGTGWDGDDPLCVACPSIESITGGEVVVSTDGVSTIAVYECHNGYSMIGVQTLYCQPNGTWTSDSPECVQCPMLEIPNSGLLNQSTDGQTAILTYSCAEGYMLQGVNIRTCETDGTWSEAEPTCVCSTPPRPVNGDVISDGMTAIYRCAEGYTMSGVSLRHCGSGGSGWNESMPSCITCDTLDTTTNAHTTFETDGIETKATFSCEVGYSLTGTTSSTCRSDGSWDFATPSCTACETLSIPDHGEVTLRTDNTTTVAMHICELGYSLKGVPLLTCRSDGTWDFAAPSCALCQSLDIPSSGHINISTDGVISITAYSCMQGYYISGPETVKCLPSGKWESNATQCKCIPPEKPTFGNFEITKDGSTILYTCDLGYSIKGTSERSCLDDGSGWEGTDSECITCDPLSTIENGNLTLTTDGIRTVVSIQCDIGSSVNGSVSVECNELGTWTETVPTCAVCPTLSQPINGEQTLSTDGSTSNVEFTCGINYTLSGQHVIACGSDGEWQSEASECVECDSLPEIDSGFIQISSNGTLTKAVYSCINGYHIFGESEIHCLTDGKWSSPMPSCVCDFSGMIENGDVRISEDGMQVTYTCRNGYSLAGAQIRTCQPSGLGWSLQAPTCAACDDARPPQNGSFKQQTDGIVTKSIFSCDVGFALNGHAELSCREDGSWNSSFPFCAICLDLDEPSSGSILFTSDGRNTHASYTCAEGYFLDGSVERTCDVTGNWDSTTPTCKCHIPSSPRHGDVTLSVNDSKAVYTCDVSYSVSGTTERYCQTDGSGWSDEEPSCVLCGSLNTLSGGDLDLATDGQRTFAKFKCDSGFSMDGSDTMICREDGTWNSTGPICNSCSVLDIPAGASLEIITDGSSTAASYKCMEGYSLLGSANLVCRSNGDWDLLPPSCVQCPGLQAPSSGQVTVITDGLRSEAVFSCSPGYYIHGGPNLTCETDGSWSSFEPECRCTIPPTPNNAAMNVSTSGAMVSYICDNGYSINGPAELICLTDGTGWDTAPPNCLKCDELIPPTNGSFSLSSNGLETTATLLCDAGSSLTGTQEMVCSADGVWNHALPSCVVCPEPSPSENESVVISTNGSVSVASFACDIGFSISGPQQLECRANGLWDNIQPICGECSSLTQQTSGTMQLSSNGTHTIATFFCSSGYELLGARMITCTADGTWDYIEPFCVCKQPPSIANGDVSISDDRTVATYTCNSGFTLTSGPIRRCEADGTGWSGDEPSCSRCEALVTPTGGVIEVTSNGKQTFANISCSSGYTITGGSELSCRTDGTWDKAIPECTICNTVIKPDNGEVKFTSNGKITTATFQCGNGYTMSGSSELSCRADGTWDFILPDCVKCPDLNTPPNSNMSMATNGITTNASFSCMNGYRIFGQDTLMCDAAGNWDDVEPSCVCIPPSSLSNGGFDISTNQMTLRYSCAVGFTLDGNAVRHCDTEGSGWDGYEPECIKCNDTENPTNGSTFMSTDGMTTYKVFNCDAGSTLNGSTVIYCNTDGSWNMAAPTCIGCPSALPPKAGSSAVETDGLASVTHFACNNGYIIFGNSNITCQTSGAWNYEAPQCVCEEPLVPANGRIHISEDRMTVSYSCDDSFTLKGNMTRTCDESGAGWDGSDPICVQCGSLDTTVGMSKQYSSDGKQSIATFTCDSGYTLLGSSVLSCHEDGAWNIKIKPKCVLCPATTAPAMGQVVVTTNGTRSKAIYSCQAGYHVFGDSEVECTDDGLWDSPQPVCHCDTPSNISGGYVVSDGLTAVYTCLSGYTLNGNMIRSCLLNGNGWDGANPSCIPCLTVATPEAGNIVSSSNGTVTKATYGCDVGYTLKGASVVTCLDDGLWDEPTPICVSCPPLGEIDSGNISMQTDGQTTYATFTCIDSYEIVGMAILTCNDKGQWDSTEPSCACRTPDAVNGHVAISTDHQKVTYTCNVGYSLQGPAEMSCLPNGGGWDQEQPECVLCNSLSFDTGNVTISVMGIQSVAAFSCAPGSSLRGSETISCNSSGSWTDKTPECVPCMTPDVPSSGGVTVTTNGTVTVATYSCSVGYILNGESTRVCGIDGDWTFSQPSCVCIEPLFISNGAFELQNNNMTAIYTCDAGYSLKGSAVRICRDDGTGWETDPPSCVKCAAIDTFSNGNITWSNVVAKTEALFTCHPGCSLSGQSKSTCQSDGTWDFQTPTCSCCPTISTISSGSVNISSDGLKTSAIFLCDNKYNLVGEEMLTCRSDGSWDFDQPSCTCKLPSEPHNGTMTVSSDSSTLTYSCNTGYSLSGASERNCLADGSGWEGTDSLCSKCDSTLSPDNGTLILSSNGVGTVATVTCDHGYSMTGEPRLTCGADGKWNQNVPSCVKCPSLNSTNGLRYNSSSDGVVTTAAFECASGYEIVGQTTLTCLRNGSWDAGQPSCMEIVVTTLTPLTCEAGGSSGATIGVAIVLSLIIVGLIIALAILGRLYRRLHKASAGGKSLMYTAEGKTSEPPYTKGPELDTDVTKLSLSTFDDIEIVSKATAPVSHRRHVLEMGRTQSSLAPSGHQKHLLELAGHTSSPAPLSHISGVTPGRSPVISSLAYRDKITGQSPSSRHVSPYGASLLTPTPRTGLRGPSATPSPVPSIEAPEYDTNLPQQILTPREVPMDGVSPKPTPTADRKVTGQDPPKQRAASSPKAAKRKKHSKKLSGSGSITPKKSQTKPPRTLRLSDMDDKDAEA